MIKSTSVIVLIALIIFSCSKNKSNFDNTISGIYSTHFIGSVDVDETGEKSSHEDIMLHEQHEELIDVLLKRVFDGTINVYSAIDPSIKLTEEEVQSILHTEEYFDVEDDNGNITNRHIKSTLKAEDISHLSFQEDWKYSDDGKLIKEVQKVAFHTQSFEEDGSYRGKLILFWLEL